MTFVEAGRKRRRWSAGAKTAAITLTLVATAVWIATACITGNIQICDPANWTGGVKNPAFLKDCCDPSFFDGGIVTWPPCPNYGGSEAGDGGDASADGPIEPPCSGQCVAFAPLGWDGPSMVWIGPQPQAPACPDTAPMDPFC